MVEKGKNAQSFVKKLIIVYFKFDIDNGFLQMYNKKTINVLFADFLCKTHKFNKKGDNSYGHGSTTKT